MHPDEFRHEPVLVRGIKASDPVASVDRHVYRGTPLSTGRFKVDDVASGHHGLTWAPDAGCIRISGRRMAMRTASGRRPSRCTRGRGQVRI